MVDHKLRNLLSVLLFHLAILPAPLLGALAQTGNVEPDISTWTNSTVGYIGNTSDGSVLVDAGSLLASGAALLGYNSGSRGTATVTGTSSKWNSNNGVINVGIHGNGTLTIEAGGQVNSYSGYLSVAPGSTGTATVTGAGSRWTNMGLLVLSYEGNGYGTLTIEAGGQVSNT